jgi:hypothetical protein
LQQLAIIIPLYRLPNDSFISVHLLFHADQMFLEELLNLFVGNVDAELLEAVVLKVLKSRQVEDTYCLMVVAL